jgi:hypothetical protein
MFLKYKNKGVFLMKKTNKMVKTLIIGAVAIALTIGIVVPNWGGDPPPSGTITILSSN